MTFEPCGSMEYAVGNSNYLHQIYYKVLWLINLMLSSISQNMEFKVYKWNEKLKKKNPVRNVKSSWFLDIYAFWSVTLLNSFNVTAMYKSIAVLPV